MSAENFLEGKIEKIENDISVVVLTDGQKINCPNNVLPDDCQVGSSIKINISLSDSGQDESVAKSILNDVLNIKN